MKIPSKSSAYFKPGQLVKNSSGSLAMICNGSLVWLNGPWKGTVAKIAEYVSLIEIENWKAD